MSEEAGAMSEKALHILRAAVADAGDEPGVYVSRARVMEQTGVGDLEEFERIAQDLAERGFIDEGVNRYEFFVVTLRGIGAGATEATEATPESREATPESREAPETVPEGEGNGDVPPVPLDPVERPSWWRRFFGLE
jgi:hypothetical protein